MLASTVARRLQALKIRRISTCAQSPVLFMKSFLVPPTTVTVYDIVLASLPVSRYLAASSLFQLATTAQVLALQFICGAAACSLAGASVVGLNTGESVVFDDGAVWQSSTMKKRRMKMNKHKLKKRKKTLKMNSKTSRQ